MRKQTGIKIEIIKNNISKNFKNSNITPQTSKTKFSKNKSHVWRPQIKNSEKWLLLKWKMIKNDFCKNFTNTKLPQNQISKKLNSNVRRPHIKKFQKTDWC